jgi:hypothetical protein
MGTGLKYQLMFTQYIYTTAIMKYQIYQLIEPEKLCDGYTAMWASLFMAYKIYMSSKFLVHRKTVRSSLAQ